MAVVRESHAFNGFSFKFPFRIIESMFASEANLGVYTTWHYASYLFERLVDGYEGPMKRIIGIYTRFSKITNMEVSNSVTDCIVLICSNA